MARRVRHTELDSREARGKLKARGKPYWRSLGRGLHIGYRKSKGGGVWVVRRYLGAGGYKVQSIGVADDTLDADGANVLDFWQAQDLARETRTPQRGAYTVKDAVRDYLESISERPSYPDVKFVFRAHVPPDLATTPIADLTADQLSKWHRALASKPPRNGVKHSDPDASRKRKATGNRTRAWLFAALNHAVEAGKVDCAPVWKQVKPFANADVPRTRYLTLAECVRLLEACDPEFRILVRAALETGARYQEIARLRVADFDPSGGTLHIRTSKSGRSRHIILTDEAAAFFARLAADKQPTDILLGRVWRPGQQRRPWRRACAQAGIEDATFHATRHTWASLASMNGMPLTIVARNLGHVDTKMVEKCYSHLSPSYVVESIRNHAPRFEVSR